MMFEILISLAWFSSDTQKMQAFLFFFFGVQAKGEIMVPGVLTGDRGNCG